MPKVKTKKSASKRFKIRAGGSVKRSRAYMRHILTKKSTKRKRHLRGTSGAHSTNKRAIHAMLPNG
jgi:large subunit ribosomal protein L35